MKDGIMVTLNHPLEIVSISAEYNRFPLSIVLNFEVEVKFLKLPRLSGDMS